MKERIRPLNSFDARLMGYFLAVGAILGTNAAPGVESVINEMLLSSNPDNYSILIKTKDETCYSDTYPTLSNGLQDLTVRDAYCPTEVDGKNRLEIVVFSSRDLTDVERIRP